jgi:hypothetical protein
LEKPGDVGDDAPEGWSDLADLDVPRRAAAAAGPAVAKLATDDVSSCFFFEPPNSPPKNPSFSFLGLSFSLSLWCFFPNRLLRPFSFSFSRPWWW